MPSRPHSMTRFNILPLFSRSTSSPIKSFLISHFLDLFLMRNSTTDRSPQIVMSSLFTVATICLPLMQPCHTHGHAIPLVNLRSLSVDVSSAHVLVTCLVILWRQFDKHSPSCWSVEVRPSHVDQCHNLCSTFTRGDLRQHHFQRLQRRRRRVQLWPRVRLVFLRDPPRAHVGLPWLTLSLLT